AGELGLPGGRFGFLSVRSIILYAIAALVLTIPMAAVSSLLHSGSEPATLLPDPRTIGQRAVDDAQARLRRTPDDAHLMTQLASAYLQRARESGDPSYYTKADGLLAAAQAELPADADLDLAERAYRRSLERVDGYAHGNAGLARVRAARGDLVGAATLYERAVAGLPLPDYVGALGDVYARLGNAGAAARQYALVDVER